ncbi:LOW QUALITY PROTEIN: testis-expressed protein 54 [Loxodonta africana]|uniref:LOW QUALITY PROTEIN: testis-expressed protein 54 n=1 Tax=Loxodonta africana TaxID=9785 RepID=UPI0030D054ED
MGCCQDKDSDEATREADSVEGGSRDAEEGDRHGRGRGGCPRGMAGGWTGDGKAKLSGLVDPLGTEGTDATDAPSRRNRKSSESLLITVLWRRLSLFSRRGSSRSNKKHSGQSQKPGSQKAENAPERIQEESEKG